MFTLLMACAAPEVPLRAPEADQGVETIGADTAVTWTPCDDAPAVAITELVAANHHGVTDADGDTSDWLELGLADAPVDLGGWWLSDDGTPAWELPEVTLEPGAALLVFASGKDRTDATELHTSFGLDALGDTVFLHMPDGCVADHVDTGRLYADVALGRSDAGAWEYFLEPTPGAANTTESRPGFAEMPVLSPEPGFYATPVEVQVTGATVYYTLDGFVPSDASTPYTGPVALDAEDEPVVLRARAYEEGLWPSRIVTGTWSEDPSILDAGVRVISLVAHPPDLWDEESGIYAFGPNAEPNYPFFGANFWQLWEKDLHVEIWDATGARVVSQDAGIQIAGGYSRAFAQRNFELLARTGYGPEQFEAPLFDDESIDSFARLYLRNGGDWCGTQIIDGTVQALFRDTTGARLDAVDAQAYEPALVYVNGAFWGVYELKERLDEGWIASHRGEDPESLDRVKLGWTHDANWEVEQGDWTAFDELNALALEDLSEPARYTDFEARVDLENFISATVAHGWIANTDWWGNNIRMWRPKRDDGRWRWMVYDFGHGWADYRYDHLATTVSGTWTGLPIGAALANDDFRNLFINVHADYLNTTLSAESATATVRALASEVRPVMARQRERWCSGASMDTWEESVAYAETFATERPGVIDAGLMTHLGLAGHATLTLTADPPEGGTFHLAVVDVESPFSGVYYQGVPVTVTAVPNAGWELEGWSGGLGSDAAIVLPMDGDTTAIASFR